MRVVLSTVADRELGRLHSDMTERVVTELRGLRDNARPPGCLLLRDFRPPTWRVRVGDWRILYEIDDEAGIVIVTGIRHRSRVYRRR
jgi:mRNA interferase RelE/StbE